LRTTPRLGRLGCSVARCARQPTPGCPITRASVGQRRAAWSQGGKGEEVKGVTIDWWGRDVIGRKKKKKGLQ
jgi:hypothetical protein